MNKDDTIAILVPESLIPHIRKFKGGILLYVDCLVVENGFDLGEGEFVTSVASFTEVMSLAGLATGSAAIIKSRD
ncbi:MULTISPECIES: hypothetical protein [Serratia]|uniref:Uncharacterized protein n=1 Tax=Serratia quinivorans TaxID=137545 RepID=A0A379YEB3_9GAMM|nr:MULTISPECIES: hypothetical protein [Serratia]RYM55457.1 hypothetical protein BSR03_27045 [Serratia proteamaculans]CAI1830965.1 Uncharacterised protein [Serratia quinivorans]SUI44104.1 Uncharacterised protein [Serratia quinivorans]